MEEGLGTSEQLPEDEGSDNEAVSEEVFNITCNGIESDGDQVLNVEANELETTAGQILEFESHEAERKCEHVLNFESSDPRDNSHQLPEFNSNGLEDPRCGDATIIDGHTGSSLGKSYPPPVVGMEFESYEDAYNYYNCYAKELGFAIRVKSSWTKRNSKEKRGAILCCNCEGFKTMKEANSRRKETRTGCLAMIRLRLVESNRWRVDEVKLEHNHLFDPERVQNSKSHKKMDAGVKRKLEPAVDVEVRTIKLYRTPAVETPGDGSSDERAVSSQIDGSTHLKLKEGHTQVIYNFFCRVQLTKPNFFYIMDLNDGGYLKNVFWIDSRSRAAYAYFGDVVVVDTTCLSKKYDIPLLAFFGLNHHKETLLLGCSLLADESFETYIWLLRAWLSCMSGRPPQTIITDRCKALQNAISEVFPRAQHRLNLSIILDSIVDSVGEVGESEVFHEVLYNTVYSSLRIDEFEVAWEEMAQQFGCRGNGCLQSLYEDRERWAPIYMKDTFLAGISIDQHGEFMCPFFDGFVHKQTNLREFFEIYDFVLQKNHQKEVLCDLDSREFSPVLRTRCNYELQLSKLYTKEIFLKFQDEMALMSNCSGIAQIHANGPVITYIVKERGVQGDTSNARDFEVTYDKIGVEVRCMCSCFNFKGYLCRHALSVLNYNGIEEIPNHYILTRWRKDFKRLYAPELGSSNIDVSNPVQQFDHLHRRAMQVVDEGMTSQDHYMVAWQAFKESLNKLRSLKRRSPFLAERQQEAQPITRESEITSNSSSELDVDASATLQMDGLSLNATIFDDETEEFDIDGECGMSEYVGQSGVLEGKNPVPPDVGMEFETYEDVYYFYNCYAKVHGFGVRVSNTWYRKSRERYRGKLSCSSAGFKKKSEANRPRPETRTGCPAMIKFRLMENRRWRIIEVEPEHNHLIHPSTEKFYKSHRNNSSGSKRPLKMNGNQEAQKIRLFRTVIIDPDDDRKLNIDEGELRNTIDQSNNHLILKPGDAQAILSFFADLQLVNPDFFYVMDLNEKGCLRNVFWAEARFKATYGYFGDVVRIDTACLISKYEVPLVVFAGVNHHGQSVPLGCGLVAGETVESFIWLLRAWLTYMVGRPPQTIIIDQSRAMQTAIADVLPRASHCISLSHIMKKVPEELGGLREYEVIKKTFTKSIYQSSRTDEFEAAWENMMLCYGIRDHKWLQTLHEDRKHWVPVYLKDTFLAGMFSATLREREASSPFDEYLSNRTPLKEFLDGYDQCVKEIYQREALADSESRNPSCMLKSKFFFEMQLSKIYTNHIFDKFQNEIEGMFSCLSTRQVGIDGEIITYLVKEREVENVNEARDYEVTFNTAVPRCGITLGCCCCCCCCLIQLLPRFFVLVVYSTWRDSCAGTHYVF